MSEHERLFSQEYSTLLSAPSLATPTFRNFSAYRSLRRTSAGQISSPSRPR